MELSYDILFSVALKHTYFLDNKLDSISIAPTKSTLHFFNRNNLLFKPNKNGFTVLYDALFAGRKRERSEVINDNAILRFQLTLNDGNFYNYTSGFEKNPTTALFYFQNMPGSTLLHPDIVVNDNSIIDIKDLKEDFFAKPFGFLDIQLSTTLEKEYSIQFAEKTTYWRYHLVSDHLKTLNNPAILKDNDAFEGPTKTVLPDKREALTFSSREPIALLEFPKSSIQLVENFEAGATKHKTIMRALPTPDIKAMSSLNGSAKKDQFTYSEIFI